MKRGIFLLGMIWIGLSCTDGFDAINTPLYPPDPGKSEGFGEGIYLGDSISIEELAQLQANISGIGSEFRNFSYEGLYNDYQITTNLTHDIYAGYFANMNPSWIMDTPTYMYHAGWSDSRWNHFYLHRTAEYRALVRSLWFVGHDFKNNTGPYLNAFYITRIYYSFLISMLTDTYGDVPLSDKQLQGLSDSESASFKTQKEVYDIIFDLLDDALNHIRPEDQNAFNWGTNDRCYGGDVNKWVRFGNTLRLRLALRIANADPEKARKEGEAALIHPGGLMQSNDDCLKTVPKFAPVDLGGENSGGDENIYALCSYKWSDAGMNKDLEIGYKTQSFILDPRCGVCWYRPLEVGSTETHPIESTRDFLGSHSGDFDIQKPSFKHSLLRSYGLNAKVLRNDAWFGYGRESIWLSYAESCFLLAEASLRGWAGAMDKTPFNYFLEGISASMQYYHISSSEEQKYINSLHILQDANANPFANSDREGMLEQIITQKWLAVFPNGNEGWAEFRRTDYPSFIQLPLINSSGGDVSEGKFIKRIAYPSEALQNNPNAQYVPTGTRVWWDVADTNDGKGVRQQPNNFR
ncbi:MAG: SusD/RagB family nutrient-binding outer membrane lipoprotein [Candidatus Azobacteroides sp.]|nr:SusD/RagB family nutrient-binding outer membrane lipoprotein [Candidatus Azobacteroides sp.]